MGTDIGYARWRRLWLIHLQGLPHHSTSVVQTRGKKGWFYATRDYSYRAKQCAGDGWVLVGDAHDFLDPLYSSGVLLALKSGEFAADAVAGALASGDLSAARLGAWGPEFNAGMDRMRRLVCQYYDGFSFGAFIRRHPHHQGDLTDLLIGNLWREGVSEVFGPMDMMRAEMASADA